MILNDELLILDGVDVFGLDLDQERRHDPAVILNTDALVLSLPWLKGIKLCGLDH